MSRTPVLITLLAYLVAVQGLQSAELLPEIQKTITNFQNAVSIFNQNAQETRVALSNTPESACLTSAKTQFEGFVDIIEDEKKHFANILSRFQQIVEDCQAANDYVCSKQQVELTAICVSAAAAYDGEIELYPDNEACLVGYVFYVPIQYVAYATSVIDILRNKCQ